MPKKTFINLSEEKQENIMRAAISKFSKLGYEKSNIGDISKTAGVAKGSMYQYFDNKKELFLYSIQWSIDLLMKKYNKYITTPIDNTNIFDYLYESSREIIVQMREEREAVIFIQEVFLGRYKNVMDESMDYILKASDKYVLDFIRQGKKNGYIREDIDDKLLCLYVTGVSFKFKEYIMNRAKSMGQEIIDEPFDEYENEIKAMIELMKNGMGRN
ncbi:MAG: transcriptional regulator [Clostridiaceae bacterium]|jgi:AcrR family transcriptional regulator|nr:transcriptional regulator [Clostridiaceae bacterium]